MTTAGGSREVVSERVWFRGMLLRLGFFSEIFGLNKIEEPYKQRTGWVDKVS